ncbi:hypothetical protein M404DRAFT_391475 [Pisolithus tinctorius Marx 270]|uniref:Uncharacterized protein n=1 Tax=Pisolithus tinctorius Marx 270 TaxID=870435 RepID=A0A0C3JF32_PISTI|nr:hypothetical protein M404DRAFT_391475 [Pisolithus tinctorius Marx 270]
MTVKRPTLFDTRPVYLNCRRVKLLSLPCMDTVIWSISSTCLWSFWDQASHSCRRMVLV